MKEIEVQVLSTHIILNHMSKTNNWTVITATSVPVYQTREVYANSIVLKRPLLEVLVSTCLIPWEYREDVTILQLARG